LTWALTDEVFAVEAASGLVPNDTPTEFGTRVIVIVTEPLWPLKASRAVMVQVPAVVVVAWYPFVSVTLPLVSVTPEELVRDPQAPDGLPLREKLTGSPVTGLPLASVTVAVIVEVVVALPLAGRVDGFAATLTPAADPKYPNRSTTRSVEPLKLKKETLPVELKVATVRLGIVCPATQFKSDASGRVPPPG
jgi:hypothetical protein